MTQAERAERTRQRILDAAVREFGKFGYEGGTVGNICKTGINKGLIYHNFTGKDELYLQCMQISTDHMMEYLRKGLDRAKEDRKNEPCRPSGKRIPAAGKDTREIIRRYMAARMKFFSEFPMESRIVFEGLTAPPGKLLSQIREILRSLDELNMEVYSSALESLRLRPGISQEQAMKYFSIMQYMFNGYFGSPAMQDKSLEEKTALHEQNLPEFLDCMVYGIAVKEDKS